MVGGTPSHGIWAGPPVTLDPWSNPNANIYQPAGYGFNDQYTEQDFLNELMDDEAAIDWTGYSPY